MDKPAAKRIPQLVKIERELSNAMQATTVRAIAKTHLPRQEGLATGSDPPVVDDIIVGDPDSGWKAEVHDVAFEVAS